MQNFPFTGYIGTAQMLQYGLTPGAKSADQIIKMVQPEPGLIRG
jgi:hypothetical protein